MPSWIANTFGIIFVMMHDNSMATNEFFLHHIKSFSRLYPGTCTMKDKNLSQFLCLLLMILYGLHLNQWEADIKDFVPG